MNLSQLVTALETRVGIPTDDGLFTTTVKNSLVNIAARKVARSSDWEWMQATQSGTTTADTRRYDLPADFDRIRDRDALIYQSITWPLRSIDELDADAGLYAWAIDDGQLVLSPTPANTGDAYTLHYIKVETTLASDSDTLALPSRYHDVIVSYAAYLAFQRSGNLAEATAARAEFDDEIRAMRKHGRYSPKPRVKVRPGGFL